MRKFSNLYKQLSTCRNAETKSTELLSYLQSASEEDRVTALKILCGSKQSAVVSINKLVKWCLTYKDLPDWMVKKCHATVGDWAETLSLILGRPELKESHDGLTAWVISIKNIGRSDDQIQSFLYRQWESRSPEELFILHKILTGSLKPIYTKPELALLLHKFYRTDSALLNLRLSKASNTALTFDQLIAPDWSNEEILSKPHEYHIPEIIALDQFHFGNPEEWVVEDFIHGSYLQVHFNESKLTVWDIRTGGITVQWQEIVLDFLTLPNQSVVDVVIPEKLSKPNSSIFGVDIHRWGGKERIELGSLVQRKKILNDWISTFHVQTILTLPHIDLVSWIKDQKQISSASGWMIKHRNLDQTPYRIKPKGLQANLQLLYVEYHHQQSAIEYTLTLGAINSNEESVPICKVHSSALPESDKMALYYWTQNNMVQRFGPISMVRSGQIFVISYDRIELNKRVKAGINLINVNVLLRQKMNKQKSTLTSIEEIKNNFF